jgi:hypothetical protein
LRFLKERLLDDRCKIEDWESDGLEGEVGVMRVVVVRGNCSVASCGIVALGVCAWKRGWLS